MADVFSNELAAGYNTRPTIAVTQAHVILPKVARVNIPAGLISADAQVEMDAKMAAGYFTPGSVPDADELKKAKGRGLNV